MKLIKCINISALLTDILEYVKRNVQSDMGGLYYSSIVWASPFSNSNSEDVINISSRDYRRS